MMRSPGCTTSGKRSNWRGIRPGSPTMSSVVRVTRSPARSGTPPACMMPTRSLGPCRSARMATGLPSSSDRARMRRMFSACPSWSPCEKFSRATSMPAFIISRKVSGSRLAGPMVQTILVRNMVVHSDASVTVQGDAESRASDDATTANRGSRHGPRCLPSRARLWTPGCLSGPVHRRASLHPTRLAPPRR